jgi:hypothetical protein
MSRSSFFVGFGRSCVAVGFRRVVGLALAGGCFSWWLRPSARSFSGLVVQSFFASRSAAAAFAGRCSALVGFAVVVRPAWSDAVAGGFCWAVSVPVVR